MSSVIINNIDFDILKINTTNYGYQNRTIYGATHTETEIIAETSINNLSLLENWISNWKRPTNYYKKDSTICNIDGQNIKFIGLFPKSYNIDFESNSNSNNIEVIFNCDYFYTSISIRELRKEKLEKLNALSTTSSK